MPDQLRVLIVEDQWMLADAFKLILAAEDDIVVLPVASDGTEAINSCARLLPDVVLIDIDVPGMDGIAVAGEINQASPASRIVIMSALPDPALRTRIVKVGARSFVSKQRAAEDLAGTLRGSVADPTDQSGTDWG